MPSIPDLVSLVGLSTLMRQVPLPLSWQVRIHQVAMGRGSAINTIATGRGSTINAVAMGRGSAVNAITTGSSFDTVCTGSVITKGSARAAFATGSVGAVATASTNVTTPMEKNYQGQNRKRPTMLPQFAALNKNYKNKGNLLLKLK